MAVLVFGAHISSIFYRATMADPMFRLVSGLLERIAGREPGCRPTTVVSRRKMEGARVERRGIMA